MKIGIVGCRVIEKSIAHIIKEYHELTLYSRNQETLKVFSKVVKIKNCSTLDELAHHSEAVVLAVKPKDLAAIAEDLDPVLEKGTMLHSFG